MAYSIDSKMKIKMTRGNTPYIPVSCYIKDENGNRVSYEPVEGDVILFSVKKKKTDTEPLFVIPVNIKDMLIKFETKHTKELDIGKYIYDVILIKPSIGYRDTFIDNKVLVLTTEVF